MLVRVWKKEKQASNGGMDAEVPDTQIIITINLMNGPLMWTTLGPANTLPAPARMEIVVFYQKFYSSPLFHVSVALFSPVSPYRLILQFLWFSTGHYTLYSFLKAPNLFIGTGLSYDLSIHTNKTPTVK